MEHFFIYPDDATADALGKPRSAPVYLAINEAMRTFVAIALPLAPGADTFFLRIAMSLGFIAPSQHPKFEFTAYDTPEMPDVSGITRLDPAVHIDSGSRADIRDKSGLVVAAAQFMPSGVAAPYGPFYNRNVYPLKITIFHPARLRMRITNHFEGAHEFVWVAADTEAGSRQPWMKVSPSSMYFNELMIGQTDTSDIAVYNSGTGDLFVNGLTPGTRPGGFYSVAINPVPYRIEPNGTGSLALHFTALDSTGLNLTDRQDLASNDPGPFGAQGHNNGIMLYYEIE